MNSIYRLLLSSIVITLIAFLSSVVIAAPIADQTQQQAPTANFIASPPNDNAAAYILIDVNSGKIIAQKNENAVRQPASLTKLMTLYLTFRAIKNGTISLDSKVLISKQAWQTGGSKMFIKVGTRVSVSDLIQGIIVDSGNDAAMALAQYVGGSINSFVSLMNEEAMRLGMKNTHFSDPTGLPEPGHVSTAYDLSLLARAIIRDFPQQYHFFSQKWFTYNGIRQPNRNRLLWRYPNADGLKTGHTKAAGYCLIASAKKNGMRLLSVVLGTPSDEARASDSIALLRYGFRFYRTAPLYQANQTISKLKIWGGKQKYTAIGLEQPLYITLPRSQFNAATVTLTTEDEQLNAPITKGQQLGSLVVKFNNKVINSEPLVALENNEQAGFIDRTTDAVIRKFDSWFSKKTQKPVPIAVSKILSPTQGSSDNLGK